VTGADRFAMTTTADQAAATDITASAVFAAAAGAHGEHNVGVYELATTYESMQHIGARRQTGVWYTPQPLAAAISRFSLDVALQRVGPEPEQVLRIIACDPACGCGPFLVEAARFLATQYAGRLIGGDPPAGLVAAVLPKVVLECVFGLDIDPVAVELARMDLSIATAGTLPPAALDRHIVCGDPLNGASHPAMDDKVGAGAPAATTA
jgi:hypothetical protein